MTNAQSSPLKIQGIKDGKPIPLDQMVSDHSPIITKYQSCDEFFSQMQYFLIGCAESILMAEVSDRWEYIKELATYIVEESENRLKFCCEPTEYPVVMAVYIIIHNSVLTVTVISIIEDTH